MSRRFRTAWERLMDQDRERQRAELAKVARQISDLSKELKAKREAVTK